MLSLAQLFEWLIGFKFEIDFPNGINTVDEINAEIAAEQSLIDTDSTRSQDYLNFLKFLSNHYEGYESQFSSAIEYLLATKCSTKNAEMRKEFKIRNLFLKNNLWDNDAQIQFYKRNEDGLKLIQGLSDFLKNEFEKKELKKKPRDHYEILKDQLKNQNPLSIIPLFQAFVDNPNLFVAAIWWLLDRDVTPEQIIESYILHMYVEYNLHTLAEANAPINELYHYLTISRDFNLIFLANKTSTGLRGYESYTLTGKNTSEKLAVYQNPNKVATFVLTDESFKSLYLLFGNFFLIQALTWYKESKNESLGRLLARWFNREQPEFSYVHWEDELEGFIQELFKRTHPKLMKTFAELILEENLVTLIHKKRGVFLYLIRYVPQIIPSIDFQILKRFFKDICFKSDLEVFENRKYLVKLLNAIREDISSAEELLIDYILKAYLTNPILNEDEDFSRFLYDEIDIPTLRKKSQQITNAFVDYLASISIDEFSLELYQSIEARWNADLKKINLLMEIGLDDTQFPMSKSNLFIFIIHSHYSKDPEHISFNQIKTAVEVFATQLQDSLSELEDSYINIMIAIDEPSIREAMILLLEGDPINIYNWRELDAYDKPILYSAVKEGNIGLVSYLLEDFSDLYTTEIIDTCIRKAAKHQKWSVLQYLFILEAPNLKPSLKAIDEAFKIVSEQQLDDAIIFLDNLPPESQPSPEARIVNCFNAIIDDNWERVNFLFSLNSMPPDFEDLYAYLAKQGNYNAMLELPVRLQKEITQECLDKAVKQAIAAEHWSIVIQLTKYKNPKLSQTAFDVAFCALVEHHSFKHVDEIGFITTPSKEAVKYSFLRLAETNQCEKLINFYNSYQNEIDNTILNDVVDTLLKAPKDNPDSSGFDSLFDEYSEFGAGSNKWYLVRTIMSSPSLAKLNFKNLQGLYTLAATHQNVTFFNVLSKFLLSISAKNAKDVSSIIENTLSHCNKACLILFMKFYVDEPSDVFRAELIKKLYMAVKNEEVEIVRYLCPLTKIPLIPEINVDELLIFAVENSSWESVKYLSSIQATHKPSDLSIEFAKQEAIRNNRGSEKAWFQNRSIPQSYNQFLNNNNGALQRAYEILNDYTKGNSRMSRFFHGHWNRHHVKEVTRIVNDLRNSDYENVGSLLNELEAIEIVNPVGSLARRIQFIRTVIMPIEDEKVESVKANLKLLNIVG